MSNEGGRPTKPSHLKVLHGEDRKNPQRINQAEPQPSAGEVAPPFELTKHAAEIWGRLAPDLEAKGVLTPWDADLFAEVCEALSILRSKRRGARRKAKAGETSPMGEYKSAVQVVTSLAGRFGLTPSDRVKLEVSGDREESGDDLLSGAG